MQYLAISIQFGSTVAKHRRDSCGGRTGSRLRVGNDVCVTAVGQQASQAMRRQVLDVCGKAKDSNSLAGALWVRTEVAGDIAAGTPAMLINHRYERFAQAA